MSAERIKNAALLRFAVQGYDATSLAEIAGDVGIKTPSIYAHFSGKQALFHQLLECASERELENIRGALQSPKPVASALRRYLYGTVDRFQSDPHLRFWLRSIYLPPPKLHEEISRCDQNFAVTLEGIILSALRHPDLGIRSPMLPYETLTGAFIGILRGVHAELLYCSSSDSPKVAAAMWTVFERSLLESA